MNSTPTQTLLARALPAMLAAVALVIGVPEGRAESLRAGGLIFSDELGGIQLLSASGSGTTDDPIRVEEAITDTNPAFLVIRRERMSSTHSGRMEAYPALGQVITKVVHNLSARVWSGFDVELRQEIGRPSTYTDGLSFDQPSGISTQTDSDRFADVRHVNEPFDMISFYGGHVNPGGRVTMTFKITDPTPTAVLYLIQQPQLLIVERSGTGYAQLPGDDRHWRGTLGPRVSLTGRAQLTRNPVVRRID